MPRRSMTLAEYTRFLERELPRELEQAVVRGLRSAALRGKGFVVQEIDKAKPYPAVDTGGLRKSVDVLLLPDGADLVVDAPHAPMINYGTRPFWPPQAPLALWALRKGLAEDEEEAEEVAFAVALTIARFGIEPRRFMDKGMLRTLKILDSEVYRELRRAV